MSAANAPTPESGLTSVELNSLPLGEELPCGLYLEIEGRSVLLRASGDRVDYALIERLILRGVERVFIRNGDFEKYREWVKTHTGQSPIPHVPAKSPEPVFTAREDAHRVALDIFKKEHPDPVIAQAIQKSKKLVVEIIKTPYAVRSISQLQTYSRGTIDHSINVCVLSTYLAIRLGYTHHVMLQHIGLGALLHDVGKRLVPIDASMDDETYDKQMEQHPQAGVEWLKSDERVPKEVKLIVAQHHEAFDGSGYPLGLRGPAIFDLARIVSIANAFDHYVADASGTLDERQALALKKMGNESYRMFEPRKLERVLTILKKGI